MGDVGLRFRLKNLRFRTVSPNKAFGLSWSPMGVALATPLWV